MHILSVSLHEICYFFRNDIFSVHVSSCLTCISQFIGYVRDDHDVSEEGSFCLENMA